MSISAANAASNATRSIVQPDRDGKVRAQPGPYARKPQAGASAHVAHAGRAPASAPTPFKPLANALCAAGADHHARLVERGVGNPTYLGSDKGGWTYFNEKNGELGISNLNLGHGLLGLGDFGTNCLVKKDGRIIFNGEPLTRNHPEASGILGALETLLQKVRDDKLPRASFIGGNTLQPPWDPRSLHFPDYVA